MSRDYKHAANRDRRKTAGSAWLSFVSGFAVGLFVAFVVYLHYFRSLPTGKAVPQPPSIAASAPAAEPAPVQPEPETVEPSVRKPRFDFYTILPEMEVKVPEWQSVGSATAGAPALEPGAYVLQVGSFEHFDEADKAKANLALHGIAADIQRVVINGRNWYRVRVGAFRDLQQVDEMRDKLQQAGMDFMLLKVKEG